MTFETLIWKYTFATKSLIVTHDESPLVYCAPELQNSFGEPYWDEIINHIKHIMRKTYMCKFCYYMQ